MRTLLLLVFYFYTVPLVFSQTEKDVFHMQQCAKWHFNFDSLQHYGNLLIQSDHPKAEAEGFYALGYSHQKNMSNDSALFYYNKANEFAEQLENYKFRSRIIKNQAVASAQAGYSERALRYVDTLYFLGVERQDTLLIALSENQRGVICKELGRLQEAVEANTRASNFYQSLNHPNLVNSLTNLALVYVEMDLDSMALRYFKKAYQSALEFKTQRLIDRAAGNLGNFYRNTDALDSALVYFNIQLSDTAQMPLREKTILFQNLAELNIQLNDLPKAKGLISKLEEVISGKLSVRREVEFYHLKMKYALAQEDWNTALTYADTSMVVLKEKGFALRMLPILSTKAMMHEKLGDYKAAVQTLKVYNSLKDSLNSANKIEAVEKIVAEYELNEKEDELKKLLLDNDQTDDYLKIAIFSVIAVLVISGAIFYQRIKLQNAGSFEDKESHTQNKNYYIQLNSGVKLLADEVVYVKSDGHYLDYHLLEDEKPVLDRDTISGRSEELENHGFLRIHRSHLVNEKHVKKVLKYEVELSNKLTLPISKRHRERLVEIGHPLFA